MPKRTDATEGFGEAIFEWRKAHGASQGEVAPVFGLSRGTLSRYESGRARVPDREIAHLLVCARRLDPALPEILARALGKPLDAWAVVGSASASSDHAARAVVLDAIVTAADALELPPGRVRAAMAAAVKKLADEGISHARALAVLAPGGSRRGA